MPLCAGKKDETQLLCRVKNSGGDSLYSLVDKGPQDMGTGHDNRARGNLNQLLLNQ